MVIYPIPPAVTEARVQLAIDETAKAAPTTIIQDLGKVIEVQRQNKPSVEFVLRCEVLPKPRAEAVKPLSEHRTTDTGFNESLLPPFQIPSRCGELDVATASRQCFPSHCLDDWPVLPNEMRRILKILCLHFDSAGLPASATRYLEIESVARGLRIFPHAAEHLGACPVSRRTGTP